MTNPPWEFWIDVGGTFTECLARRPDGEFLRHELLSSGVVKGAAGQGSTAGRIAYAQRRDEKAGYRPGWSPMGGVKRSIHRRRFAHFRRCQKPRFR